MTAIRFVAMPTIDAEHLWNGGSDAYDRLPETIVSDGPGHPCRHCLENIDAGEALLVFAYRPFPELQPYAETGPVFLHAETCDAYDGDAMPPILTTSTHYLLRGYDRDDRIVYGTGAVTPVNEIADRAEEVLAHPEVAYVHVRSARNNCYQCRIERRASNRTR